MIFLILKKFVAPISLPSNNCWIAFLSVHTNSAVNFLSECDHRKMISLEERRKKNYRRQLLDIPYYHGVLNRKEIKELLESRYEGHCLIEHVCHENDYVGGLHFYIHHQNNDGKSYKTIKAKAHYVRWDNTWEGHRIPGMRSWAPFKTLSSLIDFYLKFHYVTCKWEHEQCECDRYKIIRNPSEMNWDQFQHQHQPKSLFESSSFIIRNFFYYDRDFVKSRLPKPLFHDVFAGATVKRERKRKLYEEEDEESD
jgi:hypothetical protein